jgi:hypothetical protein
VGADGLLAGWKIPAMAGAGKKAHTCALRDERGGQMLRLIRRFLILALISFFIVDLVHLDPDAAEKMHRKEFISFIANREASWRNFNPDWEKKKEYFEHLSAGELVLCTEWVGQTPSQVPSNFRIRDSDEESELITWATSRSPKGTLYWLDWLKI